MNKMTNENKSEWKELRQIIIWVMYFGLIIFAMYWFDSFWFIFLPLIYYPSNSYK